MAKADKGTKRNSSTPPSKDDAALALDLIKSLQKNNDEDAEKKKQEEEERLRREEFERVELQRKKLVQEQINQKLRDNLKRKEAQKKTQKKLDLKNFLESGKKIKWKSLNNGFKLEGYVKEKMMFEIKRGMTLFSLYLKEEIQLKDKKINKGYLACSMSLQTLKTKSEKLI